MQQSYEGGHNGFGFRPVRDVFARECFLVHLRPHVARIEREDANIRLLRGKDVPELFEGRLRRAVPAPTFVRFDGGVGGDVEDRPVRCDSQQWQRGLGEREGSDDVGLVDLSKHVERVVGEARLGRRPEHARVVHQQIEPAEGRRGVDQRTPVPAIGDVAGNGLHGRDRAELLCRRLERGRAAGVHDEGPAIVGERSGESEAKAPGGAGDDCNLHGCLLSLFPSMHP